MGRQEREGHGFSRAARGCNGFRLQPLRVRTLHHHENRHKDWTMDIKSGNIRKAVRQFIAENVLLGVHQTAIEDATPLITGGLIDSIGMIGLVAFLESRFEIEFMPREIDVHSLDTLERIEEVVRKKLPSSGASFATGNEQEVR
jgi:acyl carrier protein